MLRDRNIFQRRHVDTVENGYARLRSVGYTDVHSVPIYADGSGILGHRLVEERGHDA
jgi:hypothetical protein